MTDPTSPAPTDPPDREITLEEWIAASQSCCAGPPDDDVEPRDTLQTIPVPPVDPGG